MTHYYIATHSTGTVHLRKSDRPYSHAAIGKSRHRASWSSRLDLANKAAASLREYASDIEVVAVSEVDSKAFAKALKATKRKFVATFMGKKFTKTIDASTSSDIKVFAIGCHDVGHTEKFWVTQADVDRAERNLKHWMEMHAKWNNCQGEIARAEARLIEARGWLEQGYREQASRDSVDVYWIVGKGQENYFFSSMSRHCVPGFKFRVSLEVTEVAA